MIVRNDTGAWNKKAASFSYLDNDNAHSRIADLIESIQPMSLLDVGCYHGNLFRVLNTRNAMPNFCMGIDLSDKVLSQAYKHDNIRYQHIDLETFDSDINFDCIVLAGICCYYKSDDSEIIKLINRLNVKWIIVQDIIKKYELYPHLKQEFTTVHEAYFTVPLSDRADRLNHRQLILFKNPHIN